MKGDPNLEIVRLARTSDVVMIKVKSSMSPLGPTLSLALAENTQCSVCLSIAHLHAHACAPEGSVWESDLEDVIAGSDTPSGRVGVVGHA